MVEYTANHNLQQFEQDEQDWSHTADMAALDRVISVKRPRPPDPDEEMPYEDTLFFDLSSGEIYVGDGEEWGEPRWVLPSPDDSDDEESGDDTEESPLTGNAFLFEGFENHDYNMIEMPDDTGGYVPKNPEAVVLSDYSRSGDTSFRLRVDYDWEYPDGVRRGTNKPIPNHRDEMKNQGYSTWNTPFWFAFSLGLDDEWRPDSHIEQVQEFHRDLSDNPGDSLSEKKEYSGSKPGKPVSTQIDGRTMQFRSDWMEDGEAKSFIEPAPFDLKAGQWYDVVMNINWSNERHADGEGFMKIWVNDTLVVDYDGNTVANDVAPPRPPELRIYKWLWNQDRITPDEKTRTYYFDDIRYGWEDAEYSDMIPGEREGTSGESVYPSWWPA